MAPWNAYMLSVPERPGTVNGVKAIGYVETSTPYRTGTVSNDNGVLKIDNNSGFDENGGK